MASKSNNEKILFGVKVRYLRQKAGLGFADFSKKTGMSVSYLNEIEKGKKFPRQDKIKALADALAVPKEELTSNQIPNAIKPIQALLDSNFLNDLPLDLFGINLARVVQILADSPLKVGAFISTLVEISRNYSLQEENFYFGALRSYLEINNNYFPHIEDQVIDFKKTHNLLAPTVSEADLINVLENKFGYRLDSEKLKEHAELQGIRSIFNPDKKVLYLNHKLETPQRIFQFAKEIGFRYLKLKDRALSASIIKVKSFEQTLSHFGASYFSAALTIDRAEFVRDLKKMFSKSKWDPSDLKSMALKYNATHEVVMQRMSNVLPAFLGIKKIFLQRNFLNTETGKVTIERELHIEEKHHPHSSALGEEYCRRWLSIQMLNRLAEVEGKDISKNRLVDAQFSHYHNTQDTYLCLSMSKSSQLRPDKKVSLTIGIKVEDDIKDKIKFLLDPAIPHKTVNITCERCPISDCVERASPPRVLQAKEKNKSIQAAIEQILEK